MSAYSFVRPSASRGVRSSCNFRPHWLQYPARRWFLQWQPGQWEVSFRLGMATNGPLVPSMIFRSRTTKLLSKVIEQKARRRSAATSMSLTRTSVISIAAPP